MPRPCTASGREAGACSSSSHALWTRIAALALVAVLIVASLARVRGSRVGFDRLAGGGAGGETDPRVLALGGDGGGGRQTPLPTSPM
ncbi:hypothetical protein FOA52_014608 [Chlamydomonas sp. UWO 241]|nr:hypothetical protein FOA52_014608 [Chlamydomonas sp. UWO 241]